MYDVYAYFSLPLILLGLTSIFEMYYFQIHLKFMSFLFGYRIHMLH